MTWIRTPCTKEKDLLAVIALHMIYSRTAPHTVKYFRGMVKQSALIMRNTGAPNVTNLISNKTSWSVIYRSRIGAEELTNVPNATWTFANWATWSGTYRQSTFVRGCIVVPSVRNPFLRQVTWNSTCPVCTKDWSRMSALHVASTSRSVLTWKITRRIVVVKAS